MKVVSINCEPNNIDCAREYEQAGEWKKAAGIYEKLAKSSGNPLALLSRLMILYRKLKLYDKEIAVINKAIVIHHQYYEPQKLKNTKADRISRQLNIAMGTADKKGKANYKPEEVLKLEKRRSVAEKRNVP